MRAGPRSLWKYGESCYPESGECGGALRGAWTRNLDEIRTAPLRERFLFCIKKALRMQGFFQHDNRERERPGRRTSGYWLWP